ncbi:MAG: hypothetical protein EBE86_003230 [Hormoscilla sp. GUM202]|nr:hypothetical protein [Hormoscilla sp. GUM202]
MQPRNFPLKAQYPEHEVVKKLAYLLAPSVVTVDRDPPMTDVRANRNWLKQNRMEYRGRWVALKDGLEVCVWREELFVGLALWR